MHLRNAHDAVFRVYGAVRKSRAPVISVVRGQSVGFGFALACVTDITIAAQSATFAINEFSHNIMPTIVMSSLVDRIPLKALMHLVWSGKVIDSRHAMTIGAVSDIAPDDELDAVANALIERLMKAPSSITPTAPPRSTSKRRCCLRATCTPSSTPRPICAPASKREDRRLRLQSGAESSRKPRIDVGKMKKHGPHRSFPARSRHGLARYAFALADDAQSLAGRARA
jgi:enoyl-CoA hydratase/carnithine racemase